MKENRKVLNYAFYATLVVPFGYIGIFLLTDMEINTIGIILFFLFPILGYLVKKGSKKASVVLLSIFVIERIYTLFNLPLNLSKSVTGVIAWFAITYVYWLCFYGAYKFLQIEVKNKN